MGRCSLTNWPKKNWKTGGQGRCRRVRRRTRPRTWSGPDTRRNFSEGFLQETGYRMASEIPEICLASGWGAGLSCQLPERRVCGRSLRLRNEKLTGYLTLNLRCPRNDWSEGFQKGIG